MVDNGAVAQAEVTGFYDRHLFPSATSHAAFEALVPENLAGRRVGDFGCGQSLFADALRRAGARPLFLDISVVAVARIGAGDRLVASLTDLPLAEASFDELFCIGVVHHVPAMERALSEVVRVLHPGGRLVLGVYAPGTVHARLRGLHDRAPAAPLRRLVRGLGRLAVWTKNAGNGLRWGSVEHESRVADLLDVPLARYESVERYAALLEAAGAHVVSTRRISQMNILVAVRPCHAGSTEPVRVMGETGRG